MGCAKHRGPHIPPLVRITWTTYDISDINIIRLQVSKKIIFVYSDNQLTVTDHLGETFSSRALNHVTLTINIVQLSVNTFLNG